MSGWWEVGGPLDGEGEREDAGGGEYVRARYSGALGPEEEFDGRED